MTRGQRISGGARSHQNVSQHIHPWRPHQAGGAGSLVMQWLRAGCEAVIIGCGSLFFFCLRECGCGKDGWYWQRPSCRLCEIEWYDTCSCNGLLQLDTAVLSILKVSAVRTAHK